MFGKTSWVESRNNLICKKKLSVFNYCYLFSTLKTYLKKKKKIGYDLRRGGGGSGQLGKSSDFEGFEGFPYLVESIPW